MSMRKLFWGGVVTAVCMAVGTYHAADYVHRHPDSTVAACTCTAYRLATHCHPLFKVAQAVMAGSPRTCCGPVDRPHPCTESCVSGGEAECEAPVCFGPPCEGLEPCEGVDPVFPPLCWPGPCDDPTLSGCQQQTTPSSKHMDLNQVMDFWMGLFRQQTPCGETEECDDVHAGKPPTCREDPATSRPYPACPHRDSCCPYSGRSCKAGVEECEPIPAPKSLCKPASEEEQEYELIPAPKKANECPACCEDCSKDCCKECCKDCCKQKPNCPQPKCCPSECDKCPTTGEKKCPTQPRVDTLEFRPTDAKKGEFDRIPF
jgi:hypothetical protein